MPKWTICILPLVFLAGCSKSDLPQAASPAATANNPAVAQGNPEPVAPPPAVAPSQAEPAAPPQQIAGNGNDVIVASQPFPNQPQQYPAQQSPMAQYPDQPVAAPPTPLQQPVTQSFAERSPEPARQPNAPYGARAEMWIPRGTALRVRIDQEVDTRHDRSGDRFSATLYEPVVVNGAAVLPTGTRFRGHLTAAAPSRRLRGRAVLGLTLDSFSFDGREYRVQTSSAYRESRSHKRHNLGFIAGGSGVGAAIGAIAGGGTGAAIGALAGGGAGVAGAAITGKKEVAVPAEAPLIFTLRAPVRI